jgi:hypothetical protein
MWRRVLAEKQVDRVPVVPPVRTPVFQLPLIPRVGAGKVARLGKKGERSTTCGRCGDPAALKPRLSCQRRLYPRVGLAAGNRWVRRIAGLFLPKKRSDSGSVGQSVGNHYLSVLLPGRWSRPRNSAHGAGHGWEKRRRVGRTWEGAWVCTSPAASAACGVGWLRLAPSRSFPAAAAGTHPRVAPCCGATEGCVRRRVGGMHQRSLFCSQNFRAVRLCREGTTCPWAMSQYESAAHRRIA